MTNAEKFKQAFGIYATELWSMPEEGFLAWLNAEAKTEDWIPCSERLPKSDGKYLVTEQFSNVFPPEVNVLCFATDLSKVKRYVFEKGESGFYRYDDEWGYVKVNNVTAWREKAEPYRVEGEE